MTDLVDAQVPQREAPQPIDRQGSVRSVPLLFAPFFAVVGGLLLNVATPSTAWWPAVFLGVLFIGAALWNQRARHGIWLGLLAGLAFWLTQIYWLTLYLGLVPWLALSSIMVLWFSLFGASAAAVTRGLTRSQLPRAGVLFLQVFIVTGLWVMREQVQSTFPYDGFSWGRIAHTQSESPLLALVSWLGFAGLAALIVFISLLPIAVWFNTVDRIGRRTLWNTAGSAVGVVAVLVLLTLVPAASVETTGTVRVAAVQGNSKSGIFDNRESGDVIADHIRETKTWLAQNTQPVDVIVWPENSAEFNVTNNSANLREIRNLVAEAEAPIVVGTILADGDGDDKTYTNSALVFSTENDALQRYDKRYPVPFAEYMPHRAFYRALAPDLVDLVQLEYEHGTTPTVLNVGEMQAGLAICFDIIFDHHAVNMNDEGAQVIFAPTNNADFGRTSQSEQQLAIARVRAVEMGRDLINISTVATSEIVASDGTALASVPQWKPGVMVSDVELKEGSTPALLYGAVITAFWLLIGGIGGVYVVFILRKPKPATL